MKEMKHFHLQITPALKTRLQVVAALTGRTLSEVGVAALEAYIAAQEMEMDSATAQRLEKALNLPVAAPVSSATPH